MSDYFTQAQRLNDFPAPSEKQAGASAAEPKLSVTDLPITEAPAAKVYSVGEYVVGDTDDTLLSGHPDIRY